MVSQGYAAKLAFDSVLPFDASSEPFEFISESLAMVQTHVNSQGIRGTRSRLADRTRIATEAITGNILMRPTVAEIDLLLPRIFGAATVAGVTDLSDSMIEFQVMVDRVAKVFTYSGCRISRAVIQGTSGGPIEFSLDIEGETESIGNAGTFPSLTIDTGNMYVFSDLTLTLNSVVTEVSSFALTIDNLLDTGRYMNSVTRAEIPAQDRQVTLTCEVPYTTTNVALHDIAIAGISGSLAMNNGSSTYTYAFGNLKSPANSPVVGAKNEIMLSLAFDVYKSGANNEVRVTKS